MIKKFVGVIAVSLHSPAFAATAAGGTVGFLTFAMGLRPEIWAFATFGAAYAYMLRKDAPRSRLIHMLVSIFIGVFGSDAAASYFVNSHKIESVFLTPLIALLIAAAFPWLFEKYIIKRK